MYQSIRSLTLKKTVNTTIIVFYCNYGYIARITQFSSQGAYKNKGANIKQKTTLIEINDKQLVNKENCN